MSELELIQLQIDKINEQLLKYGTVKSYSYNDGQAEIRKAFNSLKEAMDFLNYLHQRKSKLSGQTGMFKIYPCR